MKKLFSILIIIVFSSAIYAQCNTTEDANNTPTTCKRGYGNNNLFMGGLKHSDIAVKDAEKWLTYIYSSVIDTAIKKTIGLRGDWNASVFDTTPEGIVRSNIQMYMNVLGCTKTHELYEKHESGLVLNFNLNSLWNIGLPCRHQVQTIVNKKTVEKLVLETCQGRQVYLIEQQTESEKYNKFAYYRKDENGKYLILSNTDIQLLLPVSIFDMLTIKKEDLVAKRNHDIEYNDAIINRTFEEYLVEVNYADLKKRVSAAEAEESYKFYKTGYDDGIAAAKKTKAEDYYQRTINNIDKYIKNSSPAQLAKPCIVKGSLLISVEPIENSWFMDSPTDGMQYVTVNPAYINRKVSASTPQYIMIELRTQGNNAVSLTGIKTFENNLDFQKLQKLLQKKL